MGLTAVYVKCIIEISLHVEDSPLLSLPDLQDIIPKALHSPTHLPSRTSDNDNYITFAFFALLKKTAALTSFYCTHTRHKKQSCLPYTVHMHYDFHSTP